MTGGTRGGPYLGPETGDELTVAGLEELERLVERQSAGVVARMLPPYTGPETGELDWGTAVPGRAAGRHEAAAVTEPLGVTGGGLNARHLVRPGVAGAGSGRRDPGPGARDALVLEAGPGRVRVTPDVSLAGRRWMATAVTLSACGGLYWAWRHILAVYRMAQGDGYEFTIVFLLIFLFLAWQLALAWTERPRELSARRQGHVSRLRTVVNVPVYNEDPGLLHRVLASLFDQTRLPDKVSVVDDGSKVDYSPLRAYWAAEHDRRVEFEWIRQPNGGKRSAQMATLAGSEDFDLTITIDSDTVLHDRAIEEGCKPFADPRVMSVAGLVLALNKHKNLLVKVIDLVITTWQLTSRSALSVCGNVLVNSGPFAIYRTSVLVKARHAYGNETFMGRKVEFSDDALLTMFSLLLGKTVQQYSAVAFTTWPEGLSHHCRQQSRWCKGMFIRSFWRFRYLPLNGAAFWFEVASWIQFILSTAAFFEIFVAESLFQHRLIWVAIVITPLLTYGVTVRTLMIRRSDETPWQQIGVYLLSPLMILWGWFIFRPLRVWGMLTCLRLEWGTREDVEVTA